MRFNKQILGGLALSAAMVLAAPYSSSSQGCEFLQRLFGCGPSPAPTYAPAYAPPTCVMPAAPCAQTCVPTQTCQYIPTTSYRTVYRPTMATVYQPITSINPCSGCPVTAYRPYTVYTQQAQLVPYTSYRIAYASYAAPGYSSCAPCATAGSWGYAASPGSNCSTCTGGTISAAPATDSTYLSSPMPTQASPAISTPSATNPADTRPSLNGSSQPLRYEATPGQGVPANGSSWSPLRDSAPSSSSSRVVPAQGGETRQNSTPAPSLPDPNDRQTQRAVWQTVAFASAAVEPQIKPVVNEGVWQASDN